MLHIFVRSGQSNNTKYGRYLLCHSFVPKPKRFEKFVTMEDNLSTYAGGAMSVTEAATVDFRKPSKVVMSGNTVQNQVSSHRSPPRRGLLPRFHTRIFMKRHFFFF